MFRGIDDVYNVVSPLLAENGLCILPRVLSRQCEERQSKNGGALFYVTVEVEFDFVSSEDASKHTVKTFGEAMDSGDKATNKAMAAAFKYAMFQTFCVPLEGVTGGDADSVTHEVQTQTVDEEQAATIRDLIEATGSDTAKFCAAFGTDSVDALPAAKYAAAVAALNRKAKKAA